MYTLASDHKLIKHTDACVMDLEDMIRMYHDMPYINCALGINSTTCSWFSGFELDGQSVTFTSIQSVKSCF